MKIFYSIKNLRSLSDTPEIELRPITILVGRNSAGKSTFLRSFALLRQSLEKRSSAPILWYGDYVDFGGFKAAVTYGDLQKEISFIFKIKDMITKLFNDDYFDLYGDYRRTRRRVEFKEVTLEVSVGEQNSRTVRKRISLDIPEHSIQVSAELSKDGTLAEKYTVNGVELNSILSNHAIYFSASDVFSSAKLTTLIKSESRNMRRTVSAPAAFALYVIEILRPQVDKRISDDNVLFEAQQILTYARLDKTALHALASRTPTKSFEKLYERWISDEGNYCLAQANIACAMNHSILTLSCVGSALKEFFVSTTYLGPARARSERYYRLQELEISEIASDGQNLPMFLASLSAIDLGKFSSWVEELFGFGVGVMRNEGHISIQLRRSDFSVNVADTGYGVSQILPVLAQIWWASTVSLRGPSVIAGNRQRPITMEQPELHLHPAHQARLADALLNAVSAESAPFLAKPIFVVETHSESMINRLGELVESGRLAAENVQIIIFSSDDGGSDKTKISTSKFNKDGSLSHWPYGFFNY